MALQKRMILSAVAVLFALLLSACRQEDSITLYVTMPESTKVQNIQTNYYKEWLEEQTGYTLVFNQVPSTYDGEDLLQTISNDRGQTDLLLFYGGDGGHTLVTNDQGLTLTPYLLPLDELLEEGRVLREIFDAYPQYDWQTLLPSPDGQLYFVPQMNPSRSAQNGQSLWINTPWLKTVGGTLPTTVDELREVLYAFQTQDPNGNGIRDEVPLAGSLESYDTQSFLPILNAYTYYDPYSLGYYVEGEELRFSPNSNDWRLGMVALSDFYEDGLLHTLQFTMSLKGLAALATDPSDILGAFSASHLSDVFADTDSNLYSNFTQLSPLMGEAQGTTYEKAPIPTVGGAVVASTAYPAQAMILLELMLSEEAFLIATYGEEGVDWDWATPYDIDIFGGSALISTVQPVSGVTQNKHFGGVGTLFAYPDYVDHVRYGNYNLEHFNARALLSNEGYFEYDSLEPTLCALSLRDEAVSQGLSDLEDYINGWTLAFITGERNPRDQVDWDTYTAGFYEFYWLTDLIEEVVLS